MHQLYFLPVCPWKSFATSCIFCWRPFSPPSHSFFFHFSERGKNLLPSLALYALDSPCRRRCVLAARDAEDKRIIFTSAVKMPLKLARGEVITQLLLHYNAPLLCPQNVKAWSYNRYVLAMHIVMEIIIAAICL